MNAHASGSTAHQRSVEVISDDGAETLYIPGLAKPPAPPAPPSPRKEAPQFHLDVTVPPPVSATPRTAPSLNDLARDIARAIPARTTETLGERTEEAIEPQHRFKEADWQSHPTEDLADIVLRQAETDAQFVTRKTRIDISDDAPFNSAPDEGTFAPKVPAGVVHGRVDDRRDHGTALYDEGRPAPEAKGEPDASALAISEQILEQELAEEARLRRSKKLRIVSRIAFGLAISSLALVAAWVSYAYMRGSPPKQALVDSPPSQLMPPPAAAARAPAATQAQAEAQRPLPMTPVEPPVAALAPQPNPLLEPRPIQANPQTIAPPAQPQIAVPAIPQAPPLQVGPISTRLASITCRSTTAQEAQLLISVGIWQASDAFTAALADIGKWTGMQNGMVLFDSISKPDLSKIPAGMTVLAYSGPNQQVASANDVNAKAWIVISQRDINSKNADPTACTMRIIAPE